MTKAEVIIEHLQTLIEQWKQMEEEVAEGEEPYVPWEDEYGADLTFMIDCHPVFQGDKPCLLKEHGIDWDKDIMSDETCSECKAIWLMEEYE